MDNYIVSIRAKTPFISFYSFLFLSFVFSTNTLANNTGLEAKGAAIYKELGIEYYIASLYVDDPLIDGRSVSEYDGPQKIKIKVTAKRWSARKWRAQWQNNIAINNAPSSSTTLNSELALFTEFPKASLLAGDEIVVIYRPESGSELIFNDYSIFKTQDKRFYSYILNTWLGKFSPNRIFREKLSGQQKLNLALIQNSHQELDGDRKAKTHSWFVVEDNSHEVAAALAAAELLKQTQAREKKALVKELEDQNRKAKQLALLQEKEKAEKKAIAKKKAQKRQAEQKKVDAQKAKAEKEKKRLALKAEAKRKNKILKQQKYYYQLYQWEISTKVNEIVSYPPWAKQFNHQGTVDLSFKVDRSGQVSGIVVPETEVSKILIQEVENKVKAAAELITIPKGLKGSEWEFNAHYVFDLNNPEQEALLKPLAPAF